MNQDDLLAFLRSQRWAVEATVSATFAPQAAIIGFAVTNRLELVFDTLTSSRKVENLRSNPCIALVIGGWDEGDARTLQYEGVADFPDGAELEELKQVYFTAFPDGTARLSWPGITYIRVKPAWVRYSDFRSEPPLIIEHSFSRVS